MKINYTSQNGTTISLEKGHGNFEIIEEGKEKRYGNINGFFSYSHFYKFLSDNYPDIADKVYVDIFDFSEEEVEEELRFIKEDSSHIKDWGEPCSD